MLYSDVKKVFEGKTVLVTGHTGFKGSWLSIWLHEMGCRVVGYALENEQPKANFHLSNIGNKMFENNIGDICDYTKLKEVFDRTQPDFVFHLAAQPLVRLSYAEPVQTYAANVMGTVNVLECIKELQKDVTAIMITTDKCYENMEWEWGYRETDRLGGHDPYSSSKACCEIAIASWRKSFFNCDKQYVKKVSSVRAGNVIGGGDWALDRIVPDCIRALEEGREIELRNPSAVRPWQHVIEPLWGYIKLAALTNQGMIEPDTWNFGPDYDSCVSVEGIVKHIIEFYGKGNYYANVNVNAPKETKLLRLDNSKAKNQLDWKPVWNVKEAIGETVQWYKEYKETDVYDLCVRQIKEYCTSLEEK